MSTTQSKEGGKTIAYQIAWGLLLILIAWPVATFCAAWWVFFLPFEELHLLIPQIVEFLETIMVWPRTIGKAILTADEKFPSPW